MTQGDSLSSGATDATPVSQTLGETPSRKVEPLPPRQSELNEKDTERLNWLDAQKVKHSAHWDGKSGFGNPARWVNPSVSWTVSQSVKDGTYKIPQVLEQMSIREAIDLAMKGTNT